jgi:hypothetical protein
MEYDINLKKPNGNADIKIISWDGDINLINTENNKYSIEGIARGLCNKGHYCVQTDPYFSVAAHSIFCVELYNRIINNTPIVKKLISYNYIPKEEIEYLVGVKHEVPYTYEICKAVIILHDVSEYCLPDIPGPVKTYMPSYKHFENNIILDIYTRLNLPMPLIRKFKLIDILAQRLEKEILIPHYKVDNEVTFDAKHLIMNCANYGTKSVSAFAMYLSSVLIKANVNPTLISKTF